MSFWEKLGFSEPKSLVDFEIVEDGAEDALPPGHLTLIATKRLCGAARWAEMSSDEQTAAMQCCGLSLPHRDVVNATKHLPVAGRQLIFCLRDELTNDAAAMKFCGGGSAGGIGDATDTAEADGGEADVGETDCDGGISSGGDIDDGGSDDDDDFLTVSHDGAMHRLPGSDDDNERRDRELAWTREQLVRERAAIAAQKREKKWALVDAREAARVAAEERARACVASLVVEAEAKAAGEAAAAAAAAAATTVATTKGAAAACSSGRGVLMGKGYVLNLSVGAGAPPPTDPCWALHFSDSTEKGHADTQGRRWRKT